jgi:hypothetical protein
MTEIDRPIRRAAVTALPTLGMGAVGAATASVVADAVLLTMKPPSVHIFSMSGSVHVLSKNSFVGPY